MTDTYETVEPDALRKELLVQRLSQLEAEHIAAVFAVEQIEKGIERARVELEELDRAG